MNVNTHTKNGILASVGWIVFLALLYGLPAILTDYTFDLFADFWDGQGWIAALCFLFWTIVWFFIGRHFSVDYETKKRLYMDQYKSCDAEKASHDFKEVYLSKCAKVASRFFTIAVLFYAAAYIRGTITLKNCLVIGTFMLLSIATYMYHKRHLMNPKSFANKQGLVKLNEVRKSNNESGDIVIGQYILDADHVCLTNRHTDAKKMLTQREAQILELLAVNKNEVVKREVLLNRFWGIENKDYFASRSLDVFVKRIRTDIEDDPSLELKTVRGVGLMLLTKD